MASDASISSVTACDRDASSRCRVILSRRALTYSSSFPLALPRRTSSSVILPRWASISLPLISCKAFRRSSSEALAETSVLSSTRSFPISSLTDLFASSMASVTASVFFLRSISKPMTVVIATASNAYGCLETSPHSFLTDAITFSFHITFILSRMISFSLMATSTVIDPVSEIMVAEYSDVSPMSALSPLVSRPAPLIVYCTMGSSFSPSSIDISLKDFFTLSIRAWTVLFIVSNSLITDIPSS